jgi:CRP-like cAMP-binding protein
MTMPTPHSPKQNHVLASLPAEDYARLLPDLELVPMPSGWAAYESGGQMSYVYFPTTSVVSLLQIMEDGATSEFAITGNEGLVGVPLFMGGSKSLSHAVVHSTGFSYRMRASVLKRELEEHNQLQLMALRYAHSLITQMAQTAVCNRHHQLEQQLCRWLLLSLDRISGNEIKMTQEQIANMLGVRREGVSIAAGKLQADELILCRRGYIEILNRPEMENRVCECYGVMKKEYDRLLATCNHSSTWSKALN